MYKIKLALFFSFFLISLMSFSQIVTEVVQLDTIIETVKVIYRPTISSSYYFKKVAVFADDTSQIAIEKSFTSYGQNGLYKVYYPSGRLKVKTVFANNKINGEWTYYDPKGIIITKGIYKNGVKHGFWAYKSFKIYGRYKKGLKNKKWKKYDANEKTHTSRYKNGKLIKGEGFGNEEVVVIKDSVKDSSNVIAEKVSSPIDKEYQQAISFLTDNIVFKKALKEHFGSSFKEMNAIKKQFKKGKLQFMVDSLIMALDITSFIKEAEEGKIVVSKIDSILKNESENLRELFSGEKIKTNQELHINSTDLNSPITVIFSEVKLNLLRLNVVWNKNGEKRKFRVLLYYSNEGVLKGAEYEKP